MDIIQNIDLYPPLGVGLYELVVLVCIFLILSGAGWGVHLVIGNYSDPKKIPMVSTVKHPKWTPRLRHIRSHFRKLYLLQAPAVWIMWLELRGQGLQSTSRQTLWLESELTDDFFEYNHLSQSPLRLNVEVGSSKNLFKYSDRV